jgi:polysaccharide export outer membrane protein
MNRFSFVYRAFALTAGLLIISFGLGCAGLNSDTNSPVPGANSSGHSDTNSTGLAETSNLFQKGDKITLQFFQAPGMPPEYEQIIRDDGTITLPYNLVLMADGKTKRELEEAIYHLYVPKYFRRMTVNIKPDERYYFVDGEVKTPGLKLHPGNITVTKAIGAAGDFTDFARKTDIQVTRANGEKFHVNWNKAQKNPSLDRPIYPGDRIHVPRRWW